MPSFASDVKNELAHLMYEKACDRTAELAALLRMGGTITSGPSHTFGVNFLTENAAVARKVINLLRLEGKGVHTAVAALRSKRLKKNNNYIVRLLPSPKVTELLEHLGIMKDGRVNLGDELLDRGILRQNCCRVAYLRGAFLGGGSVNRPEAENHLELVTGSYAFADFLHRLLRKLDFPAGMTDRRDVYVVYLKEGDAILDFLGMIQADRAASRFEVARNVKEVRAQVNRLVNCETANLGKAVLAASRQLADIRALEAHGALETLSPALREAAEARRREPEASLSELAQELCLSKPGLSNRFRKLRALAAAVSQGEKKNAAGRP